MSSRKISFTLTIFVISAFLLVNGKALNTAFAQNLLKEKIWKIPDRKKSIFLERGIFHKATNNKRIVTLKNIRHSFNKRSNVERIVFDFSGKNLPQIYGSILGQNKRISVDFMNANINSLIDSFGKSHFVEKINFAKLENDHISSEIIFKKPISADIFYLEDRRYNGRLVIDITATR